MKVCDAPGHPFLAQAPHLQHGTQKAVGGRRVVVVSVSQVVRDWTHTRCLTERGVCGSSAYQRGAPGLVTQSHADWNQIQCSE